MNDPIELTPFERRLAAALRDEQTTMSDECLDPEALLDDLEHGEDHPRHLAVLRHLSDCAACRHEHSVLSQIWREARNNSIATPPAAATAAMAPSASSERTVIPQASHLPIWDWIFGTASWPKDATAPVRLGFLGMKHYPRSIWGRLWDPFRAEKKTPEEESELSSDPKND